MLAVLALGGCVPVPVPHGLEGSRAPIVEERARFLQAGVTTREEVLLTLGEPEDVLDGERMFVYRWEGALSLVLVPGPPGGPVAMFRHDLRIGFDDQGRVSSVARSK
jgi:hypothetical protein